MTKAFKRIFFAAAIPLILAGCDAGKERSEFARIYTDVIYTRERYHDTAEANPRVREILKKGNYTEETFRQKFIEYSKSSEEMRALFDSVNANFVNRTKK